MNIGNIDGNKVLNHILNEVITVFDTRFLLININIKIVKDKKMIIKLEYFFIVDYMI